MPRLKGRPNKGDRWRVCISRELCWQNQPARFRVPVDALPENLPENGGQPWVKDYPSLRAIADDLGFASWRTLEDLKRGKIACKTSKTRALAALTIERITPVPF